MIIPITVLALIGGGYQMMFEDDEEENSNVLEKAYGFAEETVPRFTDQQFRHHFRMSPKTFEDLLSKLHAVSEYRLVPTGHPEMILEKQAMIAIWCLSNMESFRSVADRFGISKSTCWDVLYRLCRKCLKMNSRYKIICWPSKARARAIMEAFQAINGFEGVIGCIDGSHIRILPPKENPNSYCNRKNFHSVLLQGVCDNRKLFTHIYAGEPGSIHDSRLFEKSDLFHGIQIGEFPIPDNSHMLGDLAYKLADYMMVGFKNNANLSNRQKNFNIKSSQIRVHIENSFALLKGRFRRLKFMETSRLDLVCLLILSACILHNICILNGDEAEDLMDIQLELEGERCQNHEDMDQCNLRVNQLAVAKRLGIMNRLQIN